MVQKKNPTTQEMGAPVEDALSVVKDLGGRPSKFTQELADEICQRLAEGESLRQICKPVDMPDRGTVIRWLWADSDYKDTFYSQYTRARQVQAEIQADECIEIADDDGLDLGFTDEGKAFVDREHIQRSKLRVDARQWRAERLLPKVYGNKQQIEHSGELKVSKIERVIVDP